MPPSSIVNKQRSKIPSHALRHSTSSCYTSVCLCSCCCRSTNSSLRERSNHNRRICIRNNTNKPDGNDDGRIAHRRRPTHQIPRATHLHLQTPNHKIARRQAAIPVQPATALHIRASARPALPPDRGRPSPSSVLDAQG